MIEYAMDEKIRVLIVDDQPLSRQGLISILSLADDIVVVGEAESGQESIRAVNSYRPDVILMDVRMAGGDGISATAEILKTHANLHVVMLTAFDDEEYVEAALKVGATGYLLKDTRADDLIASIRLIHRGHLQLAPSIAPKIVERLQPFVKRERAEVLKSLSESEQAVLRLLADGLTNQQIAAVLMFSDGTVRNYISKILMVLSVRDRTQAALWAYRNMVATEQ